MRLNNVACCWARGRTKSFSQRERIGRSACYNSLAMVKRKLKVSKKRHVNMHAELRHASRVMLGEAKEREEGSFYQVMGSLVFAAFMVEAFLNHVGPHVFKSWNDLERLSPLSKLNLVAEKLGIENDQGKRPYQTLVRLFWFRNTLAHAKSVQFQLEETHLVEVPVDEHRHEFLVTDWEEYCTESNATRVLDESEAIIRQIHKVAGMKEINPFFLGLQETLSTLLPEEESHKQ